MSYLRHVCVLNTDLSPLLKLLWKSRPKQLLSFTAKRGSLLWWNKQT